MTTPTGRPFTAATDKFAFAQAFTARPDATRAHRPHDHQRRLSLRHGVAAVRGRVQAHRPH